MIAMMDRRLRRLTRIARLAGMFGVVRMVERLCVGRLVLDVGRWAFLSRPNWHQFHSALRTSSRMILHHVWMHDAGVMRLLGRRCRGLRKQRRVDCRDKNYGQKFLKHCAVEYPRRLFAGGGIRFELSRYLAQQWPPEQHLAPAQQSARCDVAVAVPIVARAIIIIKRYFMKVPPVEFDFISLTA